MHYWFRPKRFWNIWAAYYPVSLEGWVVVAAAMITLIYFFMEVDARSLSARDALIGFAPYVIFVLLVLDFLTRWKGEYPSWWRRDWKRYWFGKKK